MKSDDNPVHSIFNGTVKNYKKSDISINKYVRDIKLKTHISGPTQPTSTKFVT